MTIHTVETLTGLARVSIQYYEQQGVARRKPRGDGPHEYEQADVERFKRVKLLRRIDVPLRDIRSVLREERTLPRIMEGHLARLGRRKEDTGAMEAVSRRVLETGAARIDEIDADSLLAEVDRLAAEGAPFVVLGGRDNADVEGAVLSVVFWRGKYLLILGMLLAVMGWAIRPEDRLRLLIFIIPYAALVVVWAVQLRARIKEIRRKGEETDAAAQY
ncbi:MAG: MerR family transcriptional regulator [Oscillospiraceae bacterium]|nr:MerR family transcriptional regulator [Oscillospiraceae bacterium]